VLKKFSSEDQSVNLTETSNSLPSLSLITHSITHKTGAPRQAVFLFIAIHEFIRRAPFPVL
jgi:hypothetical protein